MKSEYSAGERDSPAAETGADSELERHSKDRPVLGIRVTPTTEADHLAGSVLRAREAGYDCLAYATTELTGVLEGFVERLELSILPVHRSNRTDPLDPVVSFAKDAGYPGLLVQNDLESAVDFETTMSSFQDSRDYLVEVEYASPVSNEPHILVGIPAYNEEQAIGDVVEEARNYADDVLVVDDGSTDATVCQAENAGATVIEHETNKGYGGALKTVFEEAARVHADSLVIIDADGQHNPDEIPNLVETHEQTSADIVIGSRFTEDGDTDAPLYRRFGLGVVNLLTNLSLGVVRSRSWIEDTQSGFRLYSRAAVRSIAEAGDIGDNMSASTDILYHAHHNDFIVEEVGAEVNYDVEDASNLNPVSHGITLVMNILRTIEQDRPITILGVPGFLSTLLGIGFGYWTFSNYIATGTFPIGIAVVSVFFGLAGIFASFTAIILHSLNTQLKQ